MNRSMAAIVASVLAIALAGPASGSARPTALSEPRPVLGQSAAPAIPQVTLLDPGAEPRTLLRYRLTAGQTETLEMVMTMSMTTRYGSEEVSADVPAMRMVASIEIASVAEDGSADLEMTVTEAGLADPAATGDVADALRTSFDGLVGTSMHYRIGDRGQVLESQVSIPSALDPTAQQTMQSFSDQLGQMTTPLPEEPVGPGARWEVSTELVSSGVVTQQTYDYSLLDITGDQMRLGVTIDQSADPQPMTFEGLPEGAQMTLESMASAGSGTMVVDLGGLVPRSSVSTESSTIYSITSGEERADLGVDMTLDLQVRPAG